MTIKTGDVATVAQADAEKRFVATTSVAAAVLLTGMKVVVGFSTGSIGILSEAAHSALDLVAAVVTLWAVRASSRPADADHPYGHGKIENFSALFETGLLLATCAWIVYEASKRLLGFQESHVEATPWAFVIMVISIAVDVSRSRALARAARKHRSQALEADALHFSTDVWSSSVVILGLGFVLLSQRLGIPWLAGADAVAALGVAAIAVWVSLKLGKKSVDDLLDAVPADLLARVSGAARVAGVLDVTQVRVRQAGPSTFADVSLHVGRGLSFEQAHEIAHRAEVAVREAIPGADVVVHADPIAPADEPLAEQVRVLAARQGLGAHDITFHGPDGARALDLHVEVADTLSLREAHEKVRALEESLTSTLPSLARVAAQIEPVRDGHLPREDVPEKELPIRAALESLARDRRLPCRPGDVEVYRSGEEVWVVLRCAHEGDAPVAEARARASEIERHLRARFPAVTRVLVRLEPDAG